MASLVLLLYCYFGELFFLWVSVHARKTVKYVLFGTNNDCHELTKNGYKDGFSFFI